MELLLSLIPVKIRSHEKSHRPLSILYFFALYVECRQEEKISKIISSVYRLETPKRLLVLLRFCLRKMSSMIQLIGGKKTVY